MENLPPVSEDPFATPSAPKKSRTTIILSAIIVALVLVVIGLLTWRTNTLFPRESRANTTTTNSTSSKVASTATKVQGLELDSAKAYGDKYKNGLLPVGDNKYSTDAAKKGYVYTCSQYAQNLKNDQGGAGTRGPWFTNNNTQYDINKKAKIAGSVTWTADFSQKLSDSKRTITTNDLPTHITGVFPVRSSDPAYAYDRNPNTIKGQTLTYELPLSPSYGSAGCVGGEVGIMLTGVAIFNGFDAGGRDAGAWEVQDSCQGHPQVDGEYHYHTLSSCIKNATVDTVIGFALDGFPITGPKVGEGNILTTDDLDECHGITSKITLDNKSVTMYHYVMTEDFPYSVSCFRGQATQAPHSGGAAQQGSSGQTGSQTNTKPSGQQTQGPPPPPQH